jgi:hypothetical protein
MERSCFRGSTTEADCRKLTRILAYQIRRESQNYLAIPAGYRSVANGIEFWRKLMFFPPKAEVTSSNLVGRASYLLDSK